MKLREEHVDYEVFQHGKEYQKPAEPVFLCPECYSDDVRRTNSKDCSCAEYICNECGCTFNACKGFERTTAGNVLRDILLLAMILLLIGAVVSFVAGLFLADQYHDDDGCLTKAKDILLCLGVTLGIPVTLCALSGFLSGVRDKI